MMVKGIKLNMNAAQVEKIYSIKDETGLKVSEIIRMAIDELDVSGRLEKLRTEKMQKFLAKNYNKSTPPLPNTRGIYVKYH
jgi:hypothetical protein